MILLDADLMQMVFCSQFAHICIIGTNVPLMQKKALCNAGKVPFIFCIK